MSPAHFAPAHAVRAVAVWGEGSCLPRRQRCDSSNPAAGLLAMLRHHETAAAAVQHGGVAFAVAAAQNFAVVRSGVRSD